jgi:hypothetical protein
VTKLEFISCSQLEFEVKDTMRLFPAFFVLLTIPSTAFACLMAPEPAFERMINESTLIVRGQVFRETVDKQLKVQGPTQHWSDVVIQRVYKGSPPGTIRIEWNEYALCPRAHLGKDDYGLFFLRASGSEFELVNETYGKLAVSHWQDNSTIADPFVAIERDLKQAIQNEFDRQRINHVLLLGSLRRPIGTVELRGLLPTSDEVLESAVHLTLLKLHDYSQLEAAGKLVETVESRSFVLPKQEALSLRSEISHEISRIKTPGPRVLSILQRFTRSSNDWLRQDATYALRQSNNISNVRYLIRLIDDPLENTRIQAMRGLEELLRPGEEGYGWVPGTPFNGGKTTHEEAIARWRAWWRAEGQSKYGR